jgi:hypothetical protein
MAQSAPEIESMYAPHREALLGAAPEALLMRFRDGIELLDPRVFEMEEEQLDMAFLEDAGVGKWPIRVVLGHLADSELVQTWRIRRAIVEENPVPATWDEGAFVDSGIYGGETALLGVEAIRPPTGAFVAAVYTLRQWTAATLAIAPREAWDRATLHPEFGRLTVREMLAFDTWHLEHHLRFVNAKVERLLGPRPEPEACSEGGCGKPGCACG